MYYIHCVQRLPATTCRGTCIDAREATLAHLRLIAGWPGYWEIRALRRLDGNRMEARGSFFIVAASAGDGLIYDRLGHAVE
jgi:hypothetical protein